MEMLHFADEAESEMIMGLAAVLGLRWRTLVAVIIAPPLGGASVGLIIGVILFIFAPNAVIVLVIYGFVVGAVVGIPLMATLGVLIHRRLQSIGRTQWGVYMFAGQIGGILASVALIAFGGAGYIWFLPIILLGGALTGVFFWLIRRPDRDQETRHS